jgi:signal transduction histidine kinase
VVAGSVRQAFVWTVLVALVGGVAVLVAELLRLAGQALPAFGVAVVAGGAALAVQPLRTRLVRLVDRLLYGDLRDPYRALQRLAEQTHRAPTVDAVLAGLAASVAASLRLPWACARAGGHAGEHGSRPVGGAEITVPLVSGAVGVGELAVHPGPGRRLHADEERLLAELGRHGGVAAQAVLLTDELRAGRARLVLATMQLGTVRALLRGDPEAAAERLGRLQDAAREALDTVRRLAHGLRPPALDELGLVGALRQLAESLGLRARVDEPAQLRLPAAVEVAAYRIGAEALHNVARHAATDDVDVAVRSEDGDLVLRVSDAGAGTPAGRAAGVGTLAMRERVDELGGSLLLDSVPGRGTTVEARLPVLVGEPEVLA